MARFNGEDDMDTKAEKILEAMKHATALLYSHQPSEAIYKMHPDDYAALKRNKSIQFVRYEPCNGYKIIGMTIEIDETADRLPRIKLNDHSDS